LRSVPSTGLVSLRVAGAALIFVALQRGSGRIKRADWLVLVLASLLGVVLNQFLYVKGLSLTTAINATLIGTAIPVVTLWVGVLMKQDRVTPRKLIGILIAGCGVIYLISPTQASFSGPTRFGDVLVVSNSIAYGAYLAVSKDLTARYGALTVIKWIFIVACLFTLPVGAPAIGQMISAHLSAGIWMRIVYIILFPTVGAYYLNAWALARVPPSTVAVYIYLQPLVAFALAPWMLGEKLTLRTLAAAALIFAGVAVVTRRSRSRAMKELSKHPEALGH
jgi:drug/metabolite transporter (DMT)-like permease